MEPDIFVLGACVKFDTIRNFAPNRLCYNIINLRSNIIYPIYPITADGVILLVALRNIKQTNATIYLKRNGTLLGRIGVVLEKVKTDASPEFDGYFDESTGQMLKYDEDEDWSIINFPLPKFALYTPSLVEVFLEANEKQRKIGQLHFLFAKTPKFVYSQIVAMKSKPNAISHARYSWDCPFCKDKLQVYTGFEKNDLKNDPAFIWYEDLEDRYICPCGKTNIDLKYLRENMHAMLIDGLFGKISDSDCVHMYEKHRLSKIYNEFRTLLDRDPIEEELQVFVEQNPIILHEFVPELILPKAPILTKFKSDFVILSKSSELFFVELEPSHFKVATKTGDSSAKLTHAIDQVKNWFFEFDRHRGAILDCLEINSDKVSKVSGVVIIGRENDDNEALHRIKATCDTKLSIYTYDDLLKSLAVLINSFRQI